MNCSMYLELLDSYLCDELKVETNHAILMHAELCARCRTEMAARRRLREILRRTCSETCVSDQFREQLRECLRAEATTNGKISVNRRPIIDILRKVFIKGRHR